MCKTTNAEHIHTDHITAQSLNCRHDFQYQMIHLLLMLGLCVRDEHFLSHYYLGEATFDYDCLCYASGVAVGVVVFLFPVQFPLSLLSQVTLISKAKLSPHVIVDLITSP